MPFVYPNRKETTYYCLDAEIDRARHKFPDTTFLLAALMEEVGELAQALIDHSKGKQPPENVYAEAIQVAAMAIRIAEEGDPSFTYRYNHSHYQKFNTTR